MSGIFDSLVKGLTELAPQDDPNVKTFQAKNDLSALEKKELSLFADLGRRVYADGSQSNYPDLALQLEATSAERAAIEQRMRDAEAQKLTKQKAATTLAEEAYHQRCPACDAFNAEGAKFCQSCGEKLDVPICCTACGATLKLGAKFCGECGARQGL